MSRLVHVNAIALAATLLFATTHAAAAGAEAIRFVVDAPGCADESSLARDVEALGTTFREPADDERARIFTVTITRGPPMTGRLVVRDLVGRETARETTGDSCKRVSEALAVFVAIAIDEAPPPPGPSAPARWRLPAVTVDPDVVEKPRGRRGSGGLAVNAFYGGSFDRGATEGIHAYAAWLPGLSTRFGVTATVAHDSDSAMNAQGARDAEGYSGRVGAIVGWGAPWNDVVAGFLGEGGVAAGQLSGWEYAPLPRTGSDGSPLCAVISSRSDCFAIDRGSRATLTWASPYLGWWLVLQVPWKLPVRPVAGLGGVWAPTAPDGLRLSTIAEGGLVWQAW